MVLHISSYVMMYVSLFTNRCSDADLRENLYYLKYLSIVSQIPDGGKTLCITGSEHCLKEAVVENIQDVIHCT